MFYYKRYKENKRKKKLELLSALTNTTTPKYTYIRMRVLYLMKCNNYPHRHAYNVAITEWSKLEERILWGVDMAKRFKVKTI